jgi:phytoene synthase
MSENAGEASRPDFLAQLRKSDAWRYPALLFLPKETREIAALLAAFHAEIRSFSFRVREPAAGEIRLQWWREAIEGKRAAEAAGNPLAASLFAQIGARNLDREGFLRLLDAHVFDFYHDAFPDRTALEAHLGETDSFVLLQTALAAGAVRNPALADAAGHCGVAIGLARILHEIPFRRSRGQIWLPADLLREAGLDRETWLQGAGEGHGRATALLVDMLAHHCDLARKAIGALPAGQRPVFLPLAAAETMLAAGRKAGADAIRTPVEPGPLSLQLALWKRTLFGW